MNNTRDKVKDIYELTRVLWNFSPFEKIPVSYIVSKYPTFKWLLYENIMLFNIYMSTILRTAECYYYEDSAKGVYPASWKMLIDEEKGSIIQSDYGVSHQALFLAELAQRYVGCTVDAAFIEADMQSDWHITADNIVSLVSSVVKRYEIIHVYGRQRWFTINGTLISVAMDLGSINLDIILGELTINKFRQLDYLDNKRDGNKYGLSGSIQSYTSTKMSRKNTTITKKRKYRAVTRVTGKSKTGIKHMYSVDIECSDIDSIASDSDENDSDENSHVRNKRHMTLQHINWKYSYGDFSPPEKLKVNMDIVKALDKFKIRHKPTALVLDGEMGNTTNALIRYGFYPCNIYVPNPDISICNKLGSKGVITSCTSLRTLCINGIGCKLDLVFHDTCATFHGNIHYSPISDMILMFNKRMFAFRSLYVLEISGRTPKGGYIKPTESVISEVLHTASKNNYIITDHKYYSYKNTNKNQKKTGALMWVFMFWVQDTLSSVEEKEKYATSVLERQANMINWKNNKKAMFVSIIPSQHKIIKSKKKHVYGARIVFPTMKCGESIRDMRVCDISSSKYAYCNVCDNKRANGVYTHKNRPKGVLHAPIYIGNHFNVVSKFMV